MKRISYLVAVLFALSLLLLTGCGGEDNKGMDRSSSSSTATGAVETPKAGKEEKEQENRELTVTLYFPDEQGVTLRPEKRNVTAVKGDAYTAAIKSLLDGPKEKGNTSIFPKKAKLKSVTRKEDVAYVDFSQDLTKSFVGGSTGEEMLVGSVVNTLTEFSEIKKVQILVEGKKVESLSGHMDLSTPLSRMKNLLK